MGLRARHDALVFTVLAAMVFAASGCHKEPTCDDACAHYLSCKGVSSDAQQTQCVSSCRTSPVATSQWINDYVMTDCTTAIQVIDGPPAPNNWTDPNQNPDPNPNPNPDPNPNPNPNPNPDPNPSGCYPDGHSCSAGGDCCNGNCIDQSVNDWICY